MPHRRQSSAGKHLAIIVSALLHLWFLFWLTDVYLVFIEQKPKQPKTFVVKLQTKESEEKDKKKKDTAKEKEKEKKPKQQDESKPETFAPRHTADEVASPNNKVKKPVPLVSGEPESGMAPEAEQAANQKSSQAMGDGSDRKTVATGADVVGAKSTDGNLASHKQQSGQAAKDHMEGRGAVARPEDEEQFPEIQLSVSEATASAAPRRLGNMIALADDELAEIEIISPYAEKHAETLKMVNLYFKRMQEQLYHEWEEPEGSDPWRRVVLKMHLSADGELEDVYVYKSSNNEALDQSTIAAVEAVGAFEIPQTAEAANFFRVLRVEFVPDGQRQQE